jgi:hypothetical protein
MTTKQRCLIAGCVIAALGGLFVLMRVRRRGSDTGEIGNQAG